MMAAMVSNHFRIRPNGRCFQRISISYGARGRRRHQILTTNSRGQNADQLSQQSRSSMIEVLEVPNSTGDITQFLSTIEYLVHCVVVFFAPSFTFHSIFIHLSAAYDINDHYLYVLSNVAREKRGKLIVYA